ncbi:response regulator aspartate phosphatase [Pseudalkalibacillus sp. R45]|uniref:response regulator aspartate phosphatase n=1 Tax=Pseudalkalibacillus sp. R45 TaxID=3457433 RepID=UPI003FCE04C4
MDVMVSSNEMTDLLNSWYVEIRDRNVEKATSLKEEIDEKINNMEENQNLLLYYSLLTFRYQMTRSDDLEELDAMVSQFDQDKNEMDDMIDYYYHFFKGIHQYKQKRYEEALSSFHFAEKNLNSIPDPIETAEFHYKLASVYSQHMKILQSIQHTYKALEIFQQNEHYRLRTADCKNLLGTNHILLGNYEQANYHLNKALEYAQHVQCRETESISLQNLGWMYSRMGNPNEAIEYLTKSLEWMEEEKQYHYQIKTMYIMAKQYFNLDEISDALYWVDRCTDICRHNQDSEYLSKLKILKSKHTMELSDYMNVLKDEISFFLDKKYWGNLEEFSHDLAKYYEKERNIRDAMKYYKLVIHAKNKLS